jgi:hypothetical protein
MSKAPRARKDTTTSAIMPLLMVLTIFSVSTAQAKSNNFTLNNGSGESLSVKNGLLGGQTTAIKDRLGNTVEKKNGWFGSKSTKVKALGNSYETKKGWFGQKTTTTTTILGDKIETKKGWFGKRHTTVDVSGTSKLIGNFLSKSKTGPGNAAKPGNQSDFATRNQSQDNSHSNQDNYNPNPLANNNGFATN